MRKLISFLLVSLIFLIIPVIVFARSGCCSWHDGVCGCSRGRQLCCDGTLSPTCTCYSASNSSYFQEITQNAITNIKIEKAISAIRSDLYDCQTTSKKLIRENNILEDDNAILTYKAWFFAVAAILLAWLKKTPEKGVGTIIVPLLTYILLTIIALIVVSS